MAPDSLLSSSTDYLRTSLLPSTIKFLLPYLYHLPTPVLTLAPALYLHLSTHPSPSPLTLLSDPLSHPLHLPLIFLFTSIPIFYTLGHLSGNISWVDRAWPFYTPICSALVVAWAFTNPSASMYAHNLPRVGIMCLVQFIWSLRLLSNALRRGVYPLKAEDYRYTVMRKIVPGPVWSTVHLFAVVIFQPTLLFTLALPLTAVLMLPPSELHSYNNYHISFASIRPFLPTHLHPTATSPTTPVLTPIDGIITAFALLCIFVEYKVDKAMFAFHSSKSASKATLIQPNHSNPPNYPPATAYPISHHPGFPTTGWWAWSRHPNFAAEQLFWTSQALFVAGAARTSGITRARWVGGDVWLPPLTLSLLFCGSTFLTEWITTKKYPLYKQYRHLVGQFLPQETAFVYLWGLITGRRKAALESVYTVPVLKGEKAGSGMKSS